MTERYDFFWRAENNRVDPRTQPAKCFSLELPTGTDIEEAIAAAREAGMPRGSHRCGCFEVQCERGVWAQVEGNRMDFTTARKAAKVQFLTWEEMEALEEQEAAAA